MSRRLNLKPFLKKACPYLWPAAALLVGALLLGGAYWYTHKDTLPPPGHYPEVQQLSQVQWSFQQYSTYFQQLSQKKGALYAFQVLLYAPFPQGVDVHLLGHVVGDMLYKQKGIDAIKYCTQDFRNACSHAVVIDILEEKGEGALPEIAKVCHEAPGGLGAYTMCFHGLGHGVLAYTDYDLKKAVAMCKQVGTPEYHDQEYLECVGGTIMEMIAGVHDPVAWAAQVKNYFKDSDPLYPCDSDWMPDEARPICYTYLTPRLFTDAGADLGNMQPSTYPKAFSFCDALPKDATGLRQTCYGGFGKEFVVLAQSRDIRDVGAMPLPALQNIHDWCALAGDAAGQEACDSVALSSLFWGGENDPDASFLFCQSAPASEQSACYEQLASHIQYYLSGNPKGAALCQRLPADYQAACTAQR